MLDHFNTTDSCALYTVYLHQPKACLSTLWCPDTHHLQITCLNPLCTWYILLASDVLNRLWYQDTRQRSITLLSDFVCKSSATKHMHHLHPSSSPDPFFVYIDRIRSLFDIVVTATHCLAQKYPGEPPVTQPAPEHPTAHTWVVVAPTTPPLQVLCFS